MNSNANAATWERLRESLFARAGEPAPEPGQRSTEFRPVEGGEETLSGQTLLVEAYAALWVVLFGYVLFSWRRQSRINARIDELEKALSRSGPK
ncbi:MAG TPA: CcmD family protein [Polyangiaceae bacterium]|nr:CcmD family protein [Polyangiaceae bacterium]